MPVSGRGESICVFLLVAALLYGGLWPLMNVAFIAHCFPLPFLAGMAFYRRYSRIVGGPVQYSASLFSQAYSRHWAGVLAFTLLALAAWAIARGILRRFSSGSCNWPAAAFPVIMLILASRDMAVLYILPMVAGLAAAWLYMALCEKPHNRLGAVSGGGSIPHRVDSPVLAAGIRFSLPLRDVRPL